MVSFPWKKYAKFLETPVMTVFWGLPLGYMCNDVSNRLQQYHGLITFTPYMAMLAILFAISMVWWYLKLNSGSCLPLHRQDVQKDTSHLSSIRQHPEGTARNNARKASPSTPGLGDGSQNVIQEHSGESSCDGARYVATPILSGPHYLPEDSDDNRILKIVIPLDPEDRDCSDQSSESSGKKNSDPALDGLPPPSRYQATDVDIHGNQTSQRSRVPHQNNNVGCSADLSAESSGHGGQGVIHGDCSMRDFSSNHLPSDGRSANKAPDRILSPQLCQVDIIVDSPEIIHPRSQIMHQHKNTGRSVHLSAESSGDGGQGEIIRDPRTRNRSNNYPSDGRIGNEAPDDGAQLQSPKYSLEIISASNEDAVTRLVARLAKALPSNANVVFNINIVNNVDDAARLIKIIDPDAILRGSILLHKKRPPLDGEMLRDMRTAMDFDKDCTMQLGTMAVLKRTDAGVKCWMLRDNWTPTILDIHRYPKSFLEFLGGESPKWYATGFNIQTATLTAANSTKIESLNILHHYKRENGIEVLLFKEPLSFPPFSANLHISASNMVEVEEGVSFKLYSDAKKVQPANWISVVDGLIPRPWTLIIMASWPLLGGFIRALFIKYLQRANQEVSVPSCLVIVLLIITSTAYSLLSQKRVLSQGAAVLNRDGSAIKLQENTNTPNATTKSQLVERDASIQEGTEARASSNPASEGKIDNRTLASLIKSLSKHNDPLSQANAAGTLCKLAAQDHGVKIRILHVKGALPRLVQSLNNRESPELQANAAGVFANLAIGDNLFAKLCASRIAYEKGALSGLAASLYDDSNPKLQANAARALCHLAAGEESLRRMILSKGGVLSGLVRALSQNNNPVFQAEAARALESLAEGEELVKRRILKEKGGLEGLVSSLSNLHNPDLQTYAAGVLLNLVSLEKFSERQVFIRGRILNEDGVLAGLVSSLFEHDNPRLQANAAGALWCLASGGQSMKLRIFKEEGVIRGLVSSLSKQNNPELQAKATGALNSLAAVKSSNMKRKIINEEGALAGLVSALSNQDNPNLQACAAKALTGLAAGKESNKLRIMNEEGALSGLLSSLSEQDNSKLQAYAAETLWSLAGGGESIKLRILTEDNAVAALVKSLYKHDNPSLQANAAGALWSLAEGGESMKLRLLNKNRTVAGLVRCSSEHGNPELQKIAVRALACLAAGGEGLKREILRSEKALVDIMENLSKHSGGDLQKYARSALNYLNDVVRTEQPQSVGKDKKVLDAQPQPAGKARAS